MITRCSKLPLAMLCPASMLDDGIERTSSNQAAIMGTAVHEWLRYRIEDGLNQGIKDEVIAAKYGVDESDLVRTGMRAWKLWQQVESMFAEPKTEVAMMYQRDDFILTGTADVLSYDSNAKTVFIADHKTGWDDADYDDQGKGYAWLSMQKMPEAEKAHVVFLRLREFVSYQRTYMRAEMDAWAERMRQRLTDDAGKHFAGSHCSNCLRKWNCREYKTFINGALTIVGGSAMLMPERTEMVYNALRSVEKLVEQVRIALKAYVLDHGGRIPLNETYDLVVASQARSEIIYNADSYELLARRLPRRLLDGCIAIKKEATLKAVREGAPRGTKATVAADLMRELDEMGCVNTSTVERLERQRREEAPDTFIAHATGEEVEING